MDDRKQEGLMATGEQTNEEKIADLAQKDPIVQQALVLHWHHDLTYEQALEVAVLTLAEVNGVNFAKAVACAQLHGFPPPETPAVRGIPTTRRERAIMSHALGHEKRYRNYYAADPESVEATMWESLVERGLASKGAGVGGTSTCVYYHVTDLGKDELGPVTRQRTLTEQLDELEDDQRVSVFHAYCTDCGRKQPEDENARRCQCWNDE